MKTTKTIRYMHTIDGCPGSYEANTQICFAVRTRPIIIVDSLQQIRREEKASREWRTKQGFKTRAEYSYVRVRVS